MYEIREPVHQTISFSDEEAKVVDHPIFQRMRDIRQIGLSYLVYPGATHDRFSHMLGAMHLSGRVWDSMMRSASELLLESGYEEKDLQYFRQILRFAALLHDVGHAPFSHSSEPLMPKFGILEIPFEWYYEVDPERQAEHEDYSVMMIAAIGKENSTVITEEMAQDISSLVSGNIKPSPAWSRFEEGRAGDMHEFLKSIISGELDVDRMDYLLRDAHYTGVKYGVYDKDHLIRNLGITLQEGLFRMTIDSTAVRAFEDFLLARYHMFLQVYHHKTSNTFDYFMKKAFGEGEVTVEIPGTIDGYLALRDSTFNEALYAAAQDPKNHWSRRFIYRRPAKRLYEASADAPSTRDTLKKVLKALDNEEVNYFTINSHQYISKFETGSWFRNENAPTMFVREKRLGKEHLTPIERYSSLLKRYNEAIDIENLYVLPEDYDQAMAAIVKHGLTED